MTKRVRCGMMILLGVLLACIGVPGEVQAAAPKEVYVNGKDIIKSPDAVQGASYDASTNTLTLDSITIKDIANSSKNLTMSGVYTTGDLNIVLVGSSTIIGPGGNGTGLSVSGNLVISGTGSLTLSECGFAGILVGHNFQLQGGTVNITGLVGVDVQDTMTISSGKLSVTAATGNAICALNGLIVTGGEVTVASNKINTVQINEGDFKMTGGSVELIPGADIQPIYASGELYVYGGKIKLSGNISRMITLLNGVKISLGTGYWFSPDTTYELAVVDGQGSGQYKAGETVTIKANPSTDNRFFYCWTTIGNDVPIQLEDATKEETTFVMPAYNIKVTANYVEVLPKGTKITIGTDTYKVVTVAYASAFKEPTVAYCGTTDKSKKSVTIPDTIIQEYIKYNVVAVSKNAFKGNKNITTVNIGKNVATIENGAFKNCSKLQKITLGKGVTTIGANAFDGCKKLKNITIKSTKLKKVGKNTFRNIHTKAVIKVPKKKLQGYKKLLSNKGQKKSVKIKK